MAVPDAIPDGRARIIAAGGFLGVCQTGGVIGRVFWGFVSDRLFGGQRMIVLSIVGLLAAAASVGTAMANPSLPAWVLGSLAFVYGATAIGWNGLYQTLITESVNKRLAGMGVGFSMTLTQARNGERATPLWSCGGFNRFLSSIVANARYTLRMWKYRGCSLGPRREVERLTGGLADD